MEALLLANSLLILNFSIENRINNEASHRQACSYRRKLLLLYAFFEILFCLKFSLKHGHCL